MADLQLTAALAEKLRKYIASPTTAQSVKTEMAAFLTSGVMPSDPLTLRTLQSFLKGTPYEKQPGAFFMDLRNVGIDNGGDPFGGAGPREDRTGITPGDGGGSAPTSGPQVPPTVGTPPADPTQATGMSLAERIAAAARAAAGGPGVDIGDGATPPPMSTVGQQRAGMSSANDNGIGGGGPEGAAAQNASAQQAAQRAGQAGAGNAAAAVSYAPTSGGMGPQGGGYTGAEALDISQDDNRLIRFAMQAAGLNPDRMTRFSKTVGRALLPLLRARRAAFGIKGDENVGGLPDDIAAMAASFTHGNGRDFYNQQRAYGEQAMQSDNFKNYVAGAGDDEKVAAMYQSLMPLTYAGSNPLIQQAAADAFARQQNKFDDADVQAERTGIKPGSLVAFLQNQQNLDPITRRVFGLR